MVSYFLTVTGTLYRTEALTDSKPVDLNMLERAQKEDEDTNSDVSPQRKQPSVMH